MYTEQLQWHNINNNAIVMFHRSYIYSWSPEIWATYLSQLHTSWQADEGLCGQTSCNQLLTDTATELSTNNSPTWISWLYPNVVGLATESPPLTTILHSGTVSSHIHGVAILLSPRARAAWEATDSVFQPVYDCELIIKIPLKCHRSYLTFLSINWL